MVNKVLRAVLDGEEISDDEALALAMLPDEHLPQILAAARRLKDEAFGDTVGFCSIVNAKSGRCAEDCAFCAQSAHASTDAPTYPLRSVAEVLDAARRAKEAGVPRFSVVTSGMRLTVRDLDRVAEMIEGIRALGLAADVSVGALSRRELSRLKDAGLSGYHHNLETSERYFPRICTTHAYAEDVEAVAAAVELGLYVCSGGLFGMGESWRDRIDLARTLRGLGVPSVPVNFLTPIPGTRLANRPLMQPEEALRILAIYRLLLPRAHIRVCGGRESVFGELRADVLTSGASGIMVGDYLTTRGSALDVDREDAARLGLTIV